MVAPPDPLLALLVRVTRFDGAARVVGGRGVDGLFASGRSGSDPLLDEALGTLLEELPRAANQPRRVVLTDQGVEFIVRHHAPAERSELVRRAGPAHRERLLRAWGALASPGEHDLLRECLAELYGDFVTAPAAGLSDAATFKRAMAKELVISFDRAEHPEARRGLARVLTALGLRAIGAIGEHGRFDGRIHRSSEPLFKDDPVEVVEIGWALADEGGEILLQKAQVSARSAS